MNTVADSQYKLYEEGGRNLAEYVTVVKVRQAMVPIRSGLLPVFEVGLLHVMWVHSLRQ